MADAKNRDMGLFGNKTHINKGNPNHPPPLFNRSLTVNSSSSSSSNRAAAAAMAVDDASYINTHNPHSFRRNGSIKGLRSSQFGSTSTVMKLCHNLVSPKKNSSKSSSNPNPPSGPHLPGTENSVVIYFTSLRGVRRTFLDCHSVRMIFRGLRVKLDERDISMDLGYRKELQKVLEEKNHNITLPQVFIKGMHIGGADVIKALLESGELSKLVKGLPLKSMKPCDCCGDARFILCTNCNGSVKVFDENEQPKRCPQCNENGLIRCPICC